MIKENKSPRCLLVSVLFLMIVKQVVGINSRIWG